MSNFHLFADAVRSQFDIMAQDTLFEVAGDGLWDEYLVAFPAGSNPMFRQRTEHDCSCCRHFIRSVGNVVALQNGAITSIWDVQGLPEHYQAVADRMSALVKGRAINNVFLTKFARQGVEHNFEETAGHINEWHHFSVQVPRPHIHPNPAEVQGKLRTNYQTLLRGVSEITPIALAEVLDLIDSGALYRGAEHRAAVIAFRDFQLRWTAEDQLSCWSQCANNQLASFRNSVIGTLCQDLSAGEDVEKAVRSFETKVAPQNYRRSSALITPRMIETALSTLDSLGLRNAIERRPARLEDVSVNSVLFVDRSVRSRMRDSLSDLLLPEAQTPDRKGMRSEIPIEDFLRDILPQTTALELQVLPSHAGNFTSLTAPVHADSGRLFQWPNNFAWSYAGNVTDSIKERVKRAGGQVEGVALRVSLAWENYDDLDLHCVDPQRRHFFFGNKSNVLDVDMNAGSGTSREPVENMRWQRPTDGQYYFSVHQYSKRESIDVGFTVEIEHANGVATLSYPKPMRTGEEVRVCIIEVRNGAVTSIIPSAGIEAGIRSKEIWGLRTPDFHRVNSIILSPNHWNGEFGNKHWFFLLEGAKNPEPTRGFYNEFLHPALVPHRKVFEVLADKTKIAPSDDQLSGVGFSSTLRNKVTVKAMGPNLSNLFTIVF